MTFVKKVLAIVTCLCLLALSGTAFADPPGTVPPGSVVVGENKKIQVPDVPSNYDEWKNPPQDIKDLPEFHGTTIEGKGTLKDGDKYKDTVYSKQETDHAAQVLSNIQNPDGIIDLIKEKSDIFMTKIAPAGRTLFLWLSLLSLGIILARLLLSGEANLTSILGSLARWLVYTGVFFWIIQGLTIPWGAANDAAMPSWPKLIFNSFSKIGMDITGMTITPTGLLTRGVKIFGALFDSAKGFENSIGAVLVGVFIFLCFCLLAATFAVSLIEAFLVICGGSVMVGFAGFEYTRDIGFQYLKYSIGVGVKVLIIMLISGFAMHFGNDAIVTVRALNVIDTEFWSTIGYLLGVAVLMVLAAQMVPSIAQGIITGSSVSGSGTAALRAAAMAPVMAGGAAIGGLMAAKGMASAPSRVGSDFAQASLVARRKAAERMRRNENSADKPGAYVDPPEMDGASGAWAGVKGMGHYALNTLIFGNQHWRTTRLLGDRTNVYVDPPEN